MKQILFERYEKMDKHKYLRIKKFTNPLQIRQPFNIQNPNMSVFDIHYIDSTNDMAFWENYVPLEHRHSYNEIHVFLEGEQDYLINNNVYHLAQGSTLLIPSGMLHSISYYTPIIRKFALCISAVYLSNDPYDWIWERLNTPVILNNAMYQENLISMVFDEAQHRKKGYMQVIENLLKSFIFSLAQENAEPEEAFSIPTDSQIRTMQVKQYIKDNLDKHLDENCLSAHVHISSRQLNRNINTELGMSIKELIDQTRYEKACELLQTNIRQSDIIVLLGFNDVSSFNRFFKRMSNGITPGQWIFMNKRS